MFVEIFQNYAKKTCAGVTFLKVEGWRRPATLLKKTPTQVLRPEVSEILKDSFFAKTSANDFFCVFFKISPHTKNNIKQVWNGVSQCKEGSTLKMLLSFTYTGHFHTYIKIIVSVILKTF